MTPAEVELGLRVPPCRDLRVLGAFAARVERSGGDAVWLPDSPMLWRDTHMVLATVALRTERLTLATAVTNFVTRHPAVVESALRTLEEVAPGRIRLGVGVGQSAVIPLGLAQTDGAQLERDVALVREIISGVEVDMGGGPTQLFCPVGQPEIYVAATGPRNLAIAARCGDGVLVNNVVGDRMLAHVGGLVRQAADAAGRSVVPLALSAFCLVTDDVERDARLAKPFVAGAALRGWLGFPADFRPQVHVPGWRRPLVPDLSHAVDWADAVEACSWVSDAAAIEFIQECWFAGTPDAIARRIRTLASRHGVTKFVLQHYGSYELPGQLLTDVVPAVRAAVPRAAGSFEAPRSEG